MVNKYRGEVEAILDGRSFTLCLTLGALAELEAAFDVACLSDLVAKLSAGKFSSSQLLAILGCGLRGAGHTFTDGEVAEMQADGGVKGYANIVAQLLTATFGQQTTS